MVKVKINASKKYDIIIGKELLSSAGDLISAVKKTAKVCIVTDTNVEKIYEKTVRQSLEKTGYEVHTFSFPFGEKSKNMVTVSELLEYMAEREFTRSDLIAALGGGIVGDVAGFAAAVYLRGIDFVQIPTTFLAAVDSSVGGKTGVNLKSGKNLAGAFWQPAMVLCDCNTFNTLSSKDFLDGVAEAVKYGCICDPELFRILKSSSHSLSPSVNENSSCLENIVKRCVEIKGRLVESDEKDTGIRQLLNFGHTIGHAVEKCSNFETSHGHAVAQGMNIVARASVNMGILSESDGAKIRNILEAYGFPLEIKYTAKELTDTALKDKKRSGDSISLVILDKIGHCYLENTPVSKLEAFIESGLE